MSPGDSQSRDGAQRFDVAGLEAVGDTHVGRVRTVNQDAYGEWTDAARGMRLFFVADGMGGHRGGEVASRLAVEQVGLAFKEDEGAAPELLKNAFERANGEIFETARRDLELTGMGTTGVALALTGERLGWVAHVGDSRAYRFRDGKLEQLTDDHSVVGELVRRGQLTSEEARIHPQSNEILRAIGTQPEIETEITRIDVEPGDRYMLCSDGLSGMLSDDAIAEVVGSTPPADAVARLIELANEAGGSDNITVQIAVVPEATVSAGPKDAGAREVPSSEAAAAGSLVRWAVAIVLIAAILLILFGGSDSSG